MGGHLFFQQLLWPFQCPPVPNDTLLDQSSIPLETSSDLYSGSIPVHIPFGSCSLVLAGTCVFPDA